MYRDAFPVGEVPGRILWAVPVRESGRGQIGVCLDQPGEHMVAECRSEFNEFISISLRGPANIVVLDGVPLGPASVKVDGVIFARWTEN